MLMEVYYRHYRENCQENYWEMEEESMPYMILFPSVSEMHDFMKVLQKDGLQCVASNHSYCGLLVNLDLKRYGVIHRACKFTCVENRDYTPEEFKREVYKPWKIKNSGETCSVPQKAARAKKEDKEAKI
ncbi:MAG: hypothetical protein PUC49_07010 [Clostridiales bacterium]|nr:hypothetical protein [Clostridiales bacterium]